MFFSFIFRIKRKLFLSAGFYMNAFKLFELRQLYTGRFFCGKKISFGRDFSLFFDKSLSAIHLGNNIVFRDYCQLRSGMAGKLTIGNNVFFNNNCSINCFQKITIGDNCQFGEGVKFYDHNHVHAEKDKNINDQGYSTGSIVVGNNCWIGTNVVILKNVEIGDNVVIGAGCIVYRSIPANSVVINKQEQIFYG
jgi:UDP-3-O-[3-hydroxymyristoyl] glucosamine N-acyltransferase